MAGQQLHLQVDLLRRVPARFSTKWSCSVLSAPTANTLLDWTKATYGEEQDNPSTLLDLSDCFRLLKARQSLKESNALLDLSPTTSNGESLPPSGLRVAR